MTQRKLLVDAVARSRRSTARLVIPGGTYLDKRPCFSKDQFEEMRDEPLLEYQQFHLDHCKECKTVFDSLLS